MTTISIPGLSGTTASSRSAATHAGSAASRAGEASEAAQAAATELGFVLTPDVVIAMLRRRLGDMDHQIGVQTAALQRSTADSEKMAQKMGAAQAIQGAHQAENPDGTEAVDWDMEVTFNGETMTAGELADRYGLTVGNSGDRQRYMELRSEIAAGPEVMGRDDFGRPVMREDRLRLADQYLAENDREGNGASLETYITQLQGESRQINSGNEMRMVQLQSLMQQRSQVISMSTQMLNKIHESEQAITRNI